MTPQQVGLATNNELRSLSFIYFFKFKVEEVPNTVLAEALGLLERYPRYYLQESLERHEIVPVDKEFVFLEMVFPEAKHLNSFNTPSFRKSNSGFLKVFWKEFSNPQIFLGVGEFVWIRNEKVSQSTWNKFSGK